MRLMAAATAASAPLPMAGAGPRSTSGAAGATATATATTGRAGRGRDPGVRGGSRCCGGSGRFLFGGSLAGGLLLDEGIDLAGERRLDLLLFRQRGLGLVERGLELVVQRIELVLGVSEAGLLPFGRLAGRLGGLDDVGPVARGGLEVTPDLRMRRCRSR